MKWQKVWDAILSLLKESIKTTHNRIVTCGLLLVTLGYLPFRLGDILIRSLHGGATVLILVLLIFGLYRLWSHRTDLAKLNASDEDRFIGYTLILFGIVSFPFCLSLVWSQALVCSIILVGIACSCWGLYFFKAYPLSTLLIAAGLFPNPGVVVRDLWATFIPPLMLEQFTAWLGLWGLRLIGQAADLQDAVGHNPPVITLPGGSVSVAWGCTGFNMAMSVAIMGLILALFFKQTVGRAIALMVIGIVIALVLNIPRMVLLAMAKAYWGDNAFHFWHDGWGAQLFSATLFTIYYYAAMPFVKQKTVASST
jgi:exosortase/archaeosortase family protein